MTTTAEFLPWLAGWVTLSLRADWDEATQRSFIQQIVPLYRLRGTATGLERMLELYTGQPVEIDDDFEDPPYLLPGAADAERGGPGAAAAQAADRPGHHRPGKAGAHLLRPAGRGADDAAGVGGAARARRTRRC